jgi:hypothetical protein
MARRAGHNDDNLVVDDALTMTERFSSQDGGGGLRTKTFTMIAKK